MYRVTIKTKIPSLRELHIEVEDLESEEFKEILEQPYIDKSEEIRIEKINILTLHKKGANI